MNLLATIFFICISLHLNHAGEYTQRFLQQYNKIHASNNGYFSKEGVPYHSVETMNVEAPDYGHETTSEAYSYYIWLEAMYGAIQGDFSKFNNAWQNMENYIIPSLQPTNNFYNPSHPATYAAEYDSPDQYPAPIDSSVPVGYDPISQELKNAYGNDNIYGMHWLLDVDNIYGFGVTQGNCDMGPSANAPSYINTYQRGSMESVWRTIPQPTCDSFKYGGPNGFLDLFIKDNSYARQWKYTNAPDADARAVQAAYWAGQWANAKGQLNTISDTLTKAAKMGDYLRYALFDKYFKRIGNCVDPHSCPGGSGKESAHYLLGWYYAWGGALDSNAGWAYRIGDGAAHFGYQNPMAAWILANDQNIRPRGASAVQDWQISLDRQLEFYGWLQTSEGAFAGGATNSWGGHYGQPDSNLMANTFHGMFYDWEPVYHNPPSNRWYGMQPWSADRLAQYYYASGDQKAKNLLDKWVAWASSAIKVNGNDFQVPDQLSWSGVPPNVHVSISTYSRDIGSASATARTFAYYAAKSGNTTIKALTKSLLDALWQHQTNLGVSIEESLDAYSQFKETVYVPSGWYGTYPSGTVIQAPATFIGLRPFFKNDPNWSKIENFLNGGSVPTMTFHRFWAQADVALSQGAYGLLFNE